MKLATFEKGGVDKVGVVDTEREVVVDLLAINKGLSSAQAVSLSSMINFIEGGEHSLDIARAALKKFDPNNKEHCTPLAETNFRSPLPRPTQLRDFSVFPRHLEKGPKVLAEITRQLGGKTPPISFSGKSYPSIYNESPIFYYSNRMNVIGTRAQVDWPPDVKFLDFELELAVCIGRTAKNVSKVNANDHIFGYVIFNDVSSRDIQAIQMPGGLGPCKSKSYDGCNILGPWIVTKDEIPNPYALNVEVRVNGDVWNKSTTEGMLHTFEDMIEFASVGETLYPGEVFGSGTVGGCCGLELERWIKSGDEVELFIEGIGSLKNTFLKV